MRPKGRSSYVPLFDQIRIAGYPESSQEQDQTGGAQVGCRASARLPGQAAHACIQYKRRIYFLVVVREGKQGCHQKGNGPPDRDDN